MNSQGYYRVSIKGVAIDDTGRFLLAKEANGKWELPGGGLDHGEDPMVGLKREVAEETGLEITYISPTPKYFTTAPRVESDSFVANVIYEIKFKDLNFTPSDECTELRHFTTDEASKLDLFPNVQQFIKVFNPKLHI